MPLSPLRKLAAPSVLLLAAISIRGRMVEAYAVYGQLFDLMPYITIGLVIFLSAFFNLCRLFTASLGLLIVYFLIQTKLQVSLADPFPGILYSLISFLVPANVLLLLLLPERGLGNLYGIMTAAAIPLQVTLFWAVLFFLPVTDMITLINDRMPIRPYPGYVLSIQATACYLISFLASLLWLIRRNEEISAALLAILLFSYVTLAFFDQEKISTIMFSAAGIALLVNLISHSHNLAFRDDLTGLLGRRALNDRLKGLGKNYVIAMLDVDHFKNFNDTYGHETGDDVLKIVGKKISTVGGGGSAYRYGGEEFSILFPGKTLAECKPVLEDLRQGVASHEIIVRNLANRPKSGKKAIQRRGRRSRQRENRMISVTISIGAAERSADAGKPEDVMKAADKALYKAKEKGRNRVELAT